MPNWVYNNFSATGPSEVVDKLVADMAGPYEELNAEGELYLCTPEDQFTFRNILFIPSDKLVEYNTTHGWSNGERTGDTEYNWYNWNINNWGVKWDASDVEVYRDESDGVLYKFSTPWSTVTTLLVMHLSTRYPELIFNYDYEEEQGWGGEIQFQNGEITSSHEWDIPESHADYQANGRTCECESTDDIQYWYADCPINTEKYEWDEDENQWKEKENA